MNTNRQTKVVKEKNTKTTVKFKDNTLVSWILYKKDWEYEMDNIELIKNFIY